jgi:adenosylhomocysteine nucleosidase
MEVRPFLRQAKARRLPGLGLPAWEFRVGEGRGVLTLSGMGEDAAHLAVGRLLARCPPKILLSLGFGGALTPELAPGSIVLGQSFWRYHPETEVLQEILAPPPPRPLPDLARHLQEAGLPAFLGSTVTTPYIINKGNHRELLKGLSQPVLDLETSALAAAALAHDLAFVSLRAITDGAAEEIPPFLIRGLKKKMGKRGLGPTSSGPLGKPSTPAPHRGLEGKFPHLAGVAVTGLAADPRRLAALLHLRRRGRSAARRLAQALSVLLPLLLEPDRMWEK